MFKTKLLGIGAAVAIGLGTGLTIGIIVSLAQNGLSPESIKNAFVCGAKTGAESAVLAGAGTLLGETVGLVATKSLTEVVLGRIGGNLAESMLENITKMCNMAAVGAITIIACSIYTFAKLKIMGMSTKEALLRTGKSAALSGSILVLAIVAQGIWGGPAGIVVSVIAGVVMTGVVVYQSAHDREIREQISLKVIELSCPQYDNVAA